jgi:hypothetical protein
LARVTRRGTIAACCKGNFMLRFAVTVAALALLAAPAAAQNFGFGWLEREGTETK